MTIDTVDTVDKPETEMPRPKPKIWAARYLDPATGRLFVKRFHDRQSAENYAMVTMRAPFMQGTYEVLRHDEVVVRYARRDGQVVVS